MASSGLGSLLTSPLSKIGSAFSSIFSVQSVSAGVAQPDPFGIPQNAYTDAQIPTDPELFWDANCANGPLGRYDEESGQLDISNWLNNSASVRFDEKRGQAVYTQPNPCQLILSSMQSAGTIFDASFIPPGAAVPDQ